MKRLGCRTNNEASGKTKLDLLKRWGSNLGTGRVIYLRVGRKKVLKVGSWDYVHDQVIGSHFDLSSGTWNSVRAV